MFPNHFLPVGRPRRDRAASLTTGAAFLGLLLAQGTLKAQNTRDVQSPGTVPAEPTIPAPNQSSPRIGPPESLESKPDKGTGSDSDKGNCEQIKGGFFGRLIKAYCDEMKKPMEPFCNPKFWKKLEEAEHKSCGEGNGNGDGNGGGTAPGKGAGSAGENGNSGGNGNGNGGGNGNEPEPPRRAMPSPWPSPPFPGSEFQGFPLLGVPESTSVYPVMKALYGGPFGDQIKESRIKFTGWVTSAGNWSTAKNANTPDAYWIVPNHYELDQLVFKLERLPDTVQTDHMDWGFRSVGLYGIDYRYTTAGGWFSDQLLKNNRLNGWDPTEQYFNVYIPGFLGGTDIRIGRWIACPDIETQYSVDNYMGSHSLLFTFDTYTQTGVMLTQKINEQWMAQAVLHSGTDMAPWYKGAVATGAFGLRWVAEDNNDAFYTWLNAINSAKFRHFWEYGQPLGHDNFNYIVTTWEHRFSQRVHTKTEAYYMWQFDAELGGTPSAGSPQFFGGGGGDGVLLPGLSNTYGVLNYTMFGLSERDYVTVRNEWWKDERGMRSGFAGNYTSHTVGWSHQFNDLFMVRPECGYYSNWNNPAFDLGTRHGVWIYGFDVTMRF